MESGKSIKKQITEIDGKKVSQKLLLKEACEKFRELKKTKAKKQIEQLFFTSIKSVDEEMENGQIFSFVLTEGMLTFSSKKGNAFSYYFACYTTDVKQNSACCVINRHGRNEKEFAENFVNFFVFTFLPSKKIPVESWNYIIKN